MKISIVSMLLMLLLSTPVMAEKPSWAGKGKPSAEQKEAHQSAMDEKEKMEGEYDDAEDVSEKESKSKKEKDSDDDAEEGKEKSKDKSKNKDNKGLEKQKAGKSEQERKELDKGSDKGKEARETHSKKWWKFWGE